jgi:hypothetical protein
VVFLAQTLFILLSLSLSPSFLLLPLSLLLSFLPVLHVRLQLRVERIKNLRVLNSGRNVKPSHVLASVRQILSDLPQTYRIVNCLDLPLSLMLLYLKSYFYNF